MRHKTQRYSLTNQLLFHRSTGTKQTSQYTINLPLLENTCEDDFCEDAGTFSKDGHLPLSNLQTGYEDVFAFSAKVLPLLEGVSRWTR